jgi:hypothetical protein
MSFARHWFTAKMTLEETVKRILLLFGMVLFLMVLSAAGCGDETKTTSGDSASVATVEESDTDGAATTGDIPTDFDFLSAGEEYVTAAAGGDCEAVADLHGWTEEKDAANREVNIANCEKLNADLDELGEPTATTSREEAQPDGDVPVWVTREYADGSQWEILMTFRDKPDKGWVVSTFAYGMKQQAG